MVNWFRRFRKRSSLNRTCELRATCANEKSMTELTARPSEFAVSELDRANDRGEEIMATFKVYRPPVLKVGCFDLADAKATNPKGSHLKASRGSFQRD